MKLDITGKCKHHGVHDRWYQMPSHEYPRCSKCKVEYNKRVRQKKKTMAEQVENPKHYGGKENPYEAIKVIEAWELGFNLGNTVKYISRAGKKDPAKVMEDLKKARWYLDRQIENLTK